jgi:hypothetical protein
MFCSNFVNKFLLGLECLNIGVVKLFQLAEKNNAFLYLYVFTILVTIDGV